MNEKLENLYGFLRFAVEKHPFLFIFSIIFAGMIYLTNSIIQSPDGAFSAYIFGAQPQTEEEVDDLKKEIHLLREEIQKLLQERDKNIEQWNSEIQRLENIKAQHYNTKNMIEGYQEKMQTLEQKLQQKKEPLPEAP